MKKIFINLFAVAALGLALTACNNDADSKKTMDADNSSVDQMVQDRMKMLDDSISKACDANVSVAAEAKLDSMAKNGHKAAQIHRANHPHTAPAPDTKTDDKPATVGNGKPSMNGDGKNDGKVGNGKPNMNGSTGNTGVGNGKPKM